MQTQDHNGLMGGVVVEHRFISGILEKVKDLGLTGEDFDVMRRKKKK